MSLLLLLSFKRTAPPPGIDYNFTTGSLPSGMTFSRASSGTYFNSSGVLSTASSDVARFDYNPATLALRGLLYEPQRTNVVQNNGITVGNNVSVAGNKDDPSGGTKAYLVTEDTNTNSHVQAGVGITPSWSTAYTISTIVKPGTNDRVQIASSGGNSTTNCYANYYLSGSGSISANGSGASNCFISQLSDGFYRIGYTFTTNASGYSANMIFTASLVTGSETRLPSFTGTSRTWTVFAQQAEIGSSASSYIITTTSSATRSADVLQFTIPSGVSTLRYTFDDDTTQNVSVSAGAYTVPTNLNRAWIKRIESVSIGGLNIDGLSVMIDGLSVMIDGSSIIIQ